MPWKVCDVMSRREEFVMLAQVEGTGMTELCRRFGISRKTGYKWVGRYRDEGREGLSDRSRRPHGSPGQVSEEVESAVLAVRQQHPAWGGRKIRKVLQRGSASALIVPAASTIGQILRRRGLIDPRQALGHTPWRRFERAWPNDLWQMDYKGHVPMLDGRRCHPLTLLDDHSRFNLCLRACPDEQTGTVRPILVELFEIYGMPRQILCDNGGPWGNTPSEPYTLLSVWMMTHGIEVIHGRPRHPQTQGKEERFHRTMDDELLSRTTLADLADAQRKLDELRRTYNFVRPHEALGLEVPASRYRPSPRSYQANPPVIPFASGDLVRKVDSAGRISCRGKIWRVGKAFAGRQVGLRGEPSTDGVLNVIFANQTIKTLDLRSAASDE